MLEYRKKLQKTPSEMEACSELTRAMIRTSITPTQKGSPCKPAATQKETPKPNRFGGIELHTPPDASVSNHSKHADCLPPTPSSSLPPQMVPDQERSPIEFKSLILAQVRIESFLIQASKKFNHSQNC